MTAPLLPSLQAADLRRALTDYLATTFALTDDDVRAALTTFLGDPEEGIFRGPYARLRLPFRPADGTWMVPLDWWPKDFVPYVHQAQAFERLSSKHGRPRPTIVTTGTGSGKTEAFLVPIIDHALRMRQQGQRGMKALILYPMNALANDQAGRLAEMLTGDPRLGGLTAGIYTGEQQGQRTQVSQAGLITSREVMRSDPPDILLTNYKMLDHLLLRANDRGLWEGAQASLTYVCLDEFHTYDGAQGTDVAMLLRRLGSMLGVARPGAPLGDVVPVATSATLGAGSGASSGTEDTTNAAEATAEDEDESEEGGAGEPFAAMRAFAETVFGRPFEADAVVVEQRTAPDDWRREHSRPTPGVVIRRLPATRLLAETVREAVPEGPEQVADVLLGALVARDVDGSEFSAAEIRRLRRGDRLPAVLAAHPLTEGLLTAALHPKSVRDLAKKVLPDDTSPGRADGMAVVEAYLGLLSQARARANAEPAAGRRLLGVDTQLWVREVTRIDRRVSPTPAFRWSDDGAHADLDLYLPALYCRHCGRAGWGALRTLVGRAIDATETTVRRASRAGDQRFRALLHAPGEAAAVIADATDAPETTETTETTEATSVEGLLWLNTSTLILTTHPATDGEPDESAHIPVLTAWEDDTAARAQTCPSCRQPDGIRFLGSGVSTLTSVSLSALFGSAYLDTAEKKTLLFTDSVQDAAHTAGFVQARSHALSLRAALFDTIDSRGPLAVADLAREAMDRAGDDPVRRYRLVPPALAQWAGFQRYWQPAGGAHERAQAQRLVERRLAFDAALEFGLNARTGRTLELTGAAVAEVDTGGADALARVAARAVARARQQHSLSAENDDALGAALDDARLAAWARGVLERVRVQGGIWHRWLESFVEHDGNRWFLTGGRRAARGEGLPAFPPGRPAPTFPTTGRTSTPAATFDSITGASSWYARWAQRQLRLTARDGGLVTRALLDEMADAGWLSRRRTETNATVFLLDPAQVVVSVADPELLAGGVLALRCDVCQTLTPGTRRTVDDLADAACLRQACPGRLRRARRGDDYYRHLYRSVDMRRVVAHEHTSLLPDDVRLDVERQFREGGGPAVPNVLAATPTLELGIDIGDLSTVMLGSLPRTVASYVQRVGRAGRLTGNALVLAYVKGRGHDTQRLADPLALIDGDVRPPATYLDAVEILERQYVAWLVDRRSRGGAADPGTAATMFPEAGWAPGTWMGDLLADAHANAAAYAEEFLALFGAAVRPDTADHLRTWAGVGLAPETSGAQEASGEPEAVSGLARLLRRAAVEYRREADELGHRRNALQDSMPELAVAANRPTATAEDVTAHRLARAELRFLRDRRSALATQFWVSALEERGVLPNYTLLDDTVTLDVALQWMDQDTQEYHEEPRTYRRGSALALTEWAPGATFYAQATAVRIDAVSIGTDLDGLLQTWRVCPSCGWSRVHRRSLGDEPAVPATCPRCGDAGITDTGQALPVLPLEKVSAQVSRDAAIISDSHDDRERLPFTVVAAADVDPEQISDAWHLGGYPFGAEYVRQLEVRWVNVGRAVEQAPERMLAGTAVRAPLFLICPGCGIVPAAQLGVRDPQQARHRAWCPHRTRIDVPWTELALGRSLRTQGVRILLPPQFTLDQFAGPSFRAALLLGLRELLGGAPDHLDVLEVRMPVGGSERTALLLHDRVPGGTGYLADLARPSRVRELLTAARGVVARCGCAEDGLLACSRCLLPFSPPALVERTSRARAEQMLTEVLGDGWEPVGLRSVADIPLPSLDSALELRFRRTFTDALRARGASVREIPQLTGTELRFGVPGTVHRRWTLRPQVRAAGCRPDFELLCEDPTVPRVYVFTDGRAWHATPAHNRIADDAAKRAALREAGHVVWAVTDDDVAVFEALARGEQVTAAGAAWYDDAVRRRLVQHRAGRIPAGSVSDGLATADAVTQLLDWVMEPRRDAWRALADGLPFALFDARPAPVASRSALAGLAAAALDPHAVPDAVAGRGAAGDLQGWVWRRDGLAAASAGWPRPPHDLGCVLVLDDRDDGLATEAGVRAWRSWLALSNILGHATRTALPIALSQCTDDRSAGADRPGADAAGARADTGTGAGADRETTAVTSREDALSPPWADLVLNALDDAEKTLLRGLARAGVPLPEQGHETAGGFPLDLAWPDARVAVLVHPEDVDGALRAELTGGGWRIADPDPARVAGLLATAGGGGTDGGGTDIPVEGTR
ncbi:Helicase superfamily 1 and 2 ATP-binding [Parafrankia sp. EAN1pec]|uniref:DEAD/DEAH box helicase n=1 Tax=Parafrankia sp. (strain EAN1pec) TaxID=298653 RepID=UPI00015DA000|nr:Helicase superfamily 1 and 2 ATP-binding [Frankia sp. EAN1pec]